MRETAGCTLERISRDSTISRLSRWGFTKKLP
jgi:hypothetical protein